MTMKELVQLAWDALTFKHEAYAQHVARADVLKRGLAVLVLASLLAGTVSFIINFVNGLRPMDPVAQQQEVEQGLRDFVESLKAIGPVWDLPPNFDEQMLKYIRPNIEMGFRIAELNTPLPKRVGNVLESIGAFLSLPFSRLAGWIGYGVWVMLAAKLLGGRATARQMLGTTALYAAPHVLNVLSPIPCLGGLLGLVAMAWGIAIYVKALAVANGFTIGRAVVATIVPVLFFGVLAMLGMLGFLIVMLMAG